MNPPSRVRPGSAVRGAGVALACLLPRLPGRARAVVASYAAGWPLGKPGLQVFVVVPDEDEEPWKRAVVPFATSGASWTALMLVGASAVRRSSLPAPVAAVLLGGASPSATRCSPISGAQSIAQAAVRRPRLAGTLRQPATTAVDRGTGVRTARLPSADPLRSEQPVARLTTRAPITGGL